MEASTSPAGGQASASSATSPAESSKSSTELSFREHMWDQFDLLWRQRVEPTRRKLEVYIGCLKERAQLERQYAKGLERIFNRIQPDAEQGNLPVAMEALACNARARIEQCVQLADEIDQDVVMTIEAMLKQHAEVSRLMLGDGQKLMRHWQEASRSHEQLAARYAQVSSEAEDTAKECMALSSLRPSEWKRYATRSVALSRQAAVIEHEYCKAVDQLNTVTEVQSRHMGGLLASLQDMEEKRAQCFKDAAMKIVVHEISWVRNVQYDIESVVQAVEATDCKEELQEFIREHQTKAVPPAKVRVETYRDLAGGRQAAAQTLPEAPTVQQLEAIRPLVKALVSADFEEAFPALKDSMDLLMQRVHVEAAPATESTDGQPVAPAEPREGSAASWRRALCEVVRTEVQDSSTRVSTAAFEQAVRLISAALDGCDRAGDAWNGRDLMVAARKIQCPSADGRRMDALLRVYNHPLWSRVTFWEDVLLVGIAEASCLQSLARGGATANAEGPEVAMTSFLESYLSYMVTLGIKLDEAQACVQRTLRKHAQLLGPLVEAYAGRLCNPTNLPQPPAAPPQTSATSAEAPATEAEAAAVPDTAFGMAATEEPSSPATTPSAVQPDSPTEAAASEATSESPLAAESPPSAGSPVAAESTVAADSPLAAESYSTTVEGAVASEAASEAASDAETTAPS